MADYDRLTIKFTTPHAIAEHHKSFRDYNFICRLDARHWQSIPNKARASIVKRIANVTRNNVVECEGSTDFTGEEQENFYIRVCTNRIIENIFFHIQCDTKSKT
jgi:hypothetical protein